MRRREFIAGLGAVTWPVMARAQQAMPVVGLLAAPAAMPYAQRTAAIHQGLKDAGFVRVYFYWRDHGVVIIPFPDNPAQSE